MLRGIGDVVLHKNLYSDLHRSVEHAVYRRTQNHQVTDPHRYEEIHVIDRSRDHVIAGMAMSGHRAGHIDPMHEPAAQQRVQGVGVVGQNNLSHLRLRIAHGAGRRSMVTHEVLSHGADGDESLMIDRRDWTL